MNHQAQAGDWFLWSHIFQTVFLESCLHPHWFHNRVTKVSVCPTREFCEMLMFCLFGNFVHELGLRSNTYILPGVATCSDSSKPSGYRQWQQHVFHTLLTLMFAPWVGALMQRPACTSTRNLHHTINLKKLLLFLQMSYEHSKVILIHYGSHYYVYIFYILGDS